MTIHSRVLRMGLVGLALLGTIGDAASASQTVTPEETVRSVRRMLEHLPYYACSTTSFSASIAALSILVATASKEG